MYKYAKCYCLGDMLNLIICFQFSELVYYKKTQKVTQENEELVAHEKKLSLCYKNDCAYKPCKISDFTLMKNLSILLVIKMIHL